MQVATEAETAWTVSPSAPCTPQRGWEYKKVFLVGLNEGNVPYHKAVLEKELEEERRMFYVAMTRAKEELHLYFPRERAGKAQKISRFLQEIDRSSAVWELIEDK